MPTTTRAASAAAAFVLTFAMAACGDSTPDDPTVEPTAEESPEATTDDEAESTEDDEVTQAADDGAAGNDLPSRAEMDPTERLLAEAYFIAGVRDFGGFDAYDDEALIEAGDAVCDAMDRGDSLQSVLIVAAGLLPAAASTDAIAALGGTASGTLCPEHVDYAG